MRLIAYVVPLIIIAVSIPMVLEKIPPDAMYGFRAPKTLSSPEIWYPANRVAGQYMIVAAVFTLIVNLTLMALFPDLPRRMLVRSMTLTTVVPLLVSVAASFVYIRKL